MLLGNKIVLRGEKLKLNDKPFGLCEVHEILEFIIHEKFCFNVKIIRKFIIKCSKPKFFITSLFYSNFFSVNSNLKQPLEKEKIKKI